MSTVTTMTPEELELLEEHPLADLLPEMPQTEWAALAEDIKQHGVLQPITLYQGKILDGRHRKWICVQHVVDADTVEFEGTEDEARAYVMSLNLHRRHLTREQQRELIKRELKADPEQSDRAIAAKAKVDKNTVTAERTKLVATGEIHQSTERTGRDGRKTKAAKKPAMKSASIEAHNRQKRAAAKTQTTATAQEPEAFPQHAWGSALAAFRMAMKAAKAAGIDVHPAINALADEMDEPALSAAGSPGAVVTH